MRIIKNTFSFQSISSGTAGLLVIILDGLWNVIMNYKTNVWLIDSHPEGDGGNDHLYILAEELILPLGPQLAVETCVVSNGLDSIRSKYLRKFFCCLPVECVNDPALRLHRLDETHNAFIGLTLLDLRLNFVIEIRTIE